MIKIGISPVGEEWGRSRTKSDYNENSSGSLWVYDEFCLNLDQLLGSDRGIGEERAGA